MAIKSKVQIEAIKKRLKGRTITIDKTKRPIRPQPIRTKELTRPIGPEPVGGIITNLSGQRFTPGGRKLAPVPGSPAAGGFKPKPGIRTFGKKMSIDPRPPIGQQIPSIEAIRKKLGSPGEFRPRPKPFPATPEIPPLRKDLPKKFPTGTKFLTEFPTGLAKRRLRTATARKIPLSERARKITGTPVEQRPLPPGKTLPTPIMPILPSLRPKRRLATRGIPKRKLRHGFVPFIKKRKKR